MEYRKGRPKGTDVSRSRTTSDACNSGLRNLGLNSHLRMPPESRQPAPTEPRPRPDVCNRAPGPASTRRCKYLRGAWRRGQSRIRGGKVVSHAGDAGCQNSELRWPSQWFCEAAMLAIVAVRAAICVANLLARPLDGVGAHQLAIAINRDVVGRGRRRGLIDARRVAQPRWRQARRRHIRQRWRIEFWRRQIPNRRIERGACCPCWSVGAGVLGCGLGGCGALEPSRVRRDGGRAC